MLMYSFCGYVTFNIALTWLLYDDRMLLEGLIPASELGQLDFINNFGSSVGFSNELVLLGRMLPFYRYILLNYSIIFIYYYYYY